MQEKKICGIHIHVDAAAYNEKTLRNIVNIMAAKEDLLYKALKVKVARERYCQKADLRFLYGSNLNLQQMKYRCPTAKLYGTGMIEVHDIIKVKIFCLRLSPTFVISFFGEG